MSWIRRFGIPVAGALGAVCVLVAVTEVMLRQSTLDRALIATVSARLSEPAAEAVRFNAASFARLRRVKRLLASGADPNARESLALPKSYLETILHLPGRVVRGRSVLEMAVGCLDEDLVSTLLAFGANPDGVTMSGDSILAYASSLSQGDDPHGHVVSILLAHGASSVNAVDHTSRGPYGSYRLVNEPVLSNVVRWGDIRDADELIRQGAHPRAVDADGKDALMCAVQAAQPATVWFMAAHGADLRHRDHSGATALELARKLPTAPSYNRSEIIYQLTKYGAR